MLTSLDTAAQTIRTVDGSDGLASMFVLSVYQDVHGFVWAGTYSGLSILNGNGTSVAFTDRPEVKAEAGVMIRGIDGSDDGTVWLNTNFGLDCWNIATGRHEHHPEFTGTYEIAVGARGEVVVLTRDRGFFAYNAQTCHFEQLTAELVPYEDCHAMTVDSVGRWRVVTRTHTLEATLCPDDRGHVFATDTRKVAHEVGRLTTAKADGRELLMVGEDGVFYVGDASGRGAKPVCHLSPEMLRRQPYSGILRIGDDFLLSFYSGGVFRLRKTAAGYEEETTDISSGIFGMRHDCRQDIIWIATDGEGLRYFARAPYIITNEMFAQLPFPVSAPVRAIVRDSAGTLLLGTKGDGLLLYEHFDSRERHHSVRQLTTANSGLLHNAVYALAEGSHDLIWIGSDGTGINYYNPRTGRIGSLGTQVRHLWAVHALLEIDGEELIACTGSRGVFRLKLAWDGDEPRLAEAQQLFYDADHPSHSQFISVTRQGDFLWLANRELGIRILNLRSGRNSVWRLAGDDMRAQNDPIAVLIDTVRQQFISGASRGLHCGHINPMSSHVRDLGSTLGLADATVRGLALESRGRLWAATTQGLVCYDQTTGDFNILTVNDEIEISEFSEGAAYYAPRRDEKFFGGTDGFVVVSPALHELHVVFPPVLFTGVKVGNHYADRSYAGESGGEPLQLRHYENYLTIGFTVVDYLHANRYRFQYRLKDSGGHWLDLGHERSVSFANLPPGKYRLQVRYRSASYVSPPSELAFTIRPPGMPPSGHGCCGWRWPWPSWQEVSTFTVGNAHAGCAAWSAGSRNVAVW